MALKIYAGQPGETWTNDTDKVQWQFVADLVHTCGLCLQFHRHVGPYWPIPLHRSCRCQNVMVAVGAEAHPFVDFREVIRDLSPAQRVRVVGASSLKLIESGVVQWDDVVTWGRIRTLAEVVGRSKLSIKDLTRGGLSPARARLAYGSAHSEEADNAKRSAKAVADLLRAQGLTTEQIAKATGHIVASRVGIKAGPSGPQSVGKPPGRPPFTPLAPAMLAIPLRAKPPRQPYETPAARAVEFVTPRDLGDEYRVVTIDTSKFMPIYSQDEAFVGPQGKGGIAGRYEGFGRFFATGKPIEMPHIWMDEKGLTGFVNGRHRFSWLTDHGFTKIPVIVDRAKAAAVKRAFGAGVAIKDAIKQVVPAGVLIWEQVKAYLGIK